MSAELAEHIVAADFVAGRLPPAGYRAAQEHQLHCEPCRAAIAAAQTVYGQQQATDLATTLLNFTMRTILGGAKMLAPSLRLLPQRPAIEEQASGEDTPVFEPLRVLLPRVATGLPGLLGRFGAVLALTVGVLLLPTPAGLSAEGHRALAVFVFTAGVLALEPVSLPIAALMVPVAQVVLNVGTTPVVFEPFSRPVVFLILASLFLAEALRKQGLTRRLALMTLVASGGAVPLLLLGLMGVAAVLSMWVENTATAAVLIPVALTISRQVPDPEKARPLLVLLVLGIAYSASLGGMVTVMGAASNAVASGFLAEIRPWTFFDWMRYGLPAFLLIFPLTWWVLLKLVRVDVQQIDIEPVRQRVAKLGPMGSAEREVLLTLVGAALLWIGGAWIEPALGLPPTLLSAAMVAVMAIAYLAIRKLLNWEDVKGVSWGIFFIIGAGLSLGEALSRTGATAWFATILKPLVVGPPLVISMLLLVFLSALLTNIMNNTTIAAVFIPVLLGVAKEIKASASKLLMPMSFASMFGGTCSLIGTSTNILVSSIAEERGQPAFSMFEVAPLGLVMFGVGMLYMLLIGIRLIPDRRAESDLMESYQMQEYIAEVVLLENAPSVGHMVKDAPIAKDIEIIIIGVQRGDEVFAVPPPDLVLQAGDVLRVSCNWEEFNQLQAREGVLFKPQYKWHDQDVETKEVKLVEAIVAPSSEFVGRSVAGQSLEDLQFYEKFGAAVLAIRHRGKLLREKIADAKLDPGDSLLMEVRTDRYNQLRQNTSFIIISEVEQLAYRKNKLILALLIVAGVVLTATLSILPIVVGAIIGAVLLVLTGCMTMEDAYEAIQWRIIFLLAGVLSLEAAMEHSGAAPLISSNIIATVGIWGPVALLSAFYLMTFVFTEIMSNSATAALLTPVAIATAKAMQVSPRPFLVAVMFAASASFMTPVGYQTNTLIYGPGQYKFADFLRVGTPLNLLFWIIATILIPYFWPF